MKFVLAQIQPQAGDVESNIERHVEFIEQAAGERVDLIVFPELSITGYEPTLAAELAMTPGDPRLQCLQDLAGLHDLTIAVGLPTPHTTGIRISLALYRPADPPLLYSKQYLHEDELPFFVPGTSPLTLTLHDCRVTFAICYEVSIAAHANDAAARGTDLYLASVAKTEQGVAEAFETLSSTARNHRMTVAMVNSTGAADGGICAGSSSVWLPSGSRIQGLGSGQEALLFFDSASSRAEIRGRR